MTIKSVFKCRMPSMNYVFKSGKYAHFIEGKFLTDIVEEVEELNGEVNKGHPYIYVDENETTFDTSLQDKMNAAVAEAKLKVMREHELSLVSDNTKQTPVITSEQLDKMVTSQTLVTNPASIAVNRRASIAVNRPA